MYEINTEGISTVTLPDDNGLLILAATEIHDSREVRLNTTLYDRVEKREFDYKMSMSEKRKYNKNKKRSKKKPNQT